MPPITPVPVEWRAPAPAPVEIANGSTPKMNASDVIRIGRKRSLAASIAAAMARVDQARAQYKAAEFTQLPEVNIGAGASRSRFSLADNPPLPFGTPAISSNFNANLNASYELDLWGKYRMATNAAQNRNRNALNRTFICASFSIAKPDRRERRRRRSQVAHIRPPLLR